MKRMAYLFVGLTAAGCSTHCCADLLDTFCPARVQEAQGPRPRGGVCDPRRGAVPPTGVPEGYLPPIPIPTENEFPPNPPR